VLQPETVRRDAAAFSARLRRDSTSVTAASVPSCRLAVAARLVASELPLRALRAVGGDLENGAVRPPPDGFGPAGPAAFRTPKLTRTEIASSLLELRTQRVDDLLEDDELAGELGVAAVFEHGGAMILRRLGAAA